MFLRHIVCIETCILQSLNESRLALGADADNSDSHGILLERVRSRELLYLGSIERSF